MGGFEEVAHCLFRQHTECACTEGRRLVRAGLWKYARYPNYFGEMCMWWGIWLLCIPVFGRSAYWLSVASPLFVMSILLFLSGIPLQVLPPPFSPLLVSPRISQPPQPPSFSFSLDLASFLLSNFQLSCPSPTPSWPALQTSFVRNLAADITSSQKELKAIVQESTFQSNRSNWHYWGRASHF